MKKDKTYPYIWIAPEILLQALATLTEPLEDSQRKPTLSMFTVDFPEESWRHDTFEEFAADIRRFPTYYSYTMELGPSKLSVHQYQNRCLVTVAAPKRQTIESTFEVFERSAPSSKIEHPQAKESPPTVFIGHGRSQQWRDLKDHLHEQHGYAVEAYEVGARAGHTIRDILEIMLDESSFAILVLTGEDEDKDGKMHPRLNVVHELGLFQGALGFSRAIALLEEGTEEFSNIHGIQQIRYTKCRIRETFGDVLATLRREFYDGAV